MTATATYTRTPWEDRFNCPTAKQLREDLETDNRALFDRVRKRLAGLDGVTEALAWYGDTWKWAIEFRTALADDPLAILIPAPLDLQIAIPMELDFSRGLPIKRMKRALRDGLELALEPFDTRWGVWSVTAVGPLDDVQDLIEMKLKHLVKTAG